MTPTEYLILKDRIIEAGFQNEIDWVENLKPCASPFEFAVEYIWVVVNSGMKNQTAHKIFERIIQAMAEGKDVTTVFRHTGKVNAIKQVWFNRYEIFNKYQKAEDKLTFLKNLPWIGDITKFHLAKNLGMNIAKPDRHLVRVANTTKETVQELCERISRITGDRIATVDLVIWRACNLKLWKQ